MGSRKYSFINLTYLDKMSGGDRETKKMLLKMLIEELQASVPYMQVMLNGKKWLRLKEASHKMKSTLAFVGNKKMLTSNQTIWQAVETGCPGKQLSEHFKVLERLSPSIILELQTEYDLL